MFIDPDMPDEFQAGQARPSESEQDIESLLSALGSTVAAMRDEAVEARKASGIEEVWMACEEAYLGIDDANRHEFTGAKWAKPMSMEGPLTKNAPANNTRSTAFVRLTSRYVDMGAAKICEITLPIDDKAFNLGPTPIPDLVKDAENTSPLMDNGKQVYRPLAQGEPAPADLPAHGMVPATVGDYAKAQMDVAKAAAEKAEKRIFDWMLEAKYPLEMRKVEHEAARLGAGVLKCPFPQVKNSFARINKKLVRKNKLVPGLRSVSLWNLYPHGACGENIHDGDYIFECDKLTPAKVKALKNEYVMGPKGKIPTYIHSQIDKVLEEGPSKCLVDVGPPAERNKHKNKQFEIWYFTGVLSREQMSLMGAVGIDDLPDDVVDVNAIVTLINDSVVRATINPLESGGFPYRVHRWSRREGHWAGVGVSEQLFTPQRIVNAATRALLNNAGISAGGQIVMDRSQIEPADGVWQLVPNKIWWTRATGTNIEDVRKAFTTFTIPNLTPQIQAVIDYGFRLAEEASNIPLVVQGGEGPSTPQTFGAAELQNTNAHTLLRSIAYDLDDSITEPVVKDLYEWLLLDDDVPEEEKGDFEINAKGSIAMVERAIQEQVLAQMLPLAKDPAYGWNPKKLAARFLKAKRIDGRDVEYTEDELAQMAKQPPPEDPTITAAKIRADAQIKTAAGHDAAVVQKSKLDTDRDTAYQQSLNQRADIQAKANQEELAMRRDLEIYKENNSLKKELDSIKAELAQTAMKLKTQIQLAGADGKGPQVTTPMVEPQGRAPEGQAFQK